MLGERADGRWAAREVGYLVARQNGKGGVLDALALAALFLFEDEVETLHSAHEFKTAKKAYRNLKSLIQGAPHLMAQVERRGSRVVGFRQSNEDTSITLQNGSVIRFMARSNNTGRGFSAQRLIVDEAQECSEETRQALLYIVSAQANPQIVFCGTVPGPKNNGEVWESIRDRGRAGGDPTLAWMEWTPEDDADPADIGTALWSNPGLPYRITMETVEAERVAATTPEAWDGYCRERLSVWPSVARDVVIDPSRWAELAILGERRPSPVAFAISVPPSRAWANIGLAGILPDGRRVLQVVESARGTGWVADRVADLQTKWNPIAVLLDPSAPEGSLLPGLEKAGVEPTLVSQREYGHACGLFVDGVQPQDEGAAPSVFHVDQDLLTVAVGAARKRFVGSTWVFHPVSDAVDIAPLKAAVLALYGLEAANPPKKRSGVVVGVR